MFETYFRYSYEQGLAKKHLTIEELSHPDSRFMQVLLPKPMNVLPRVGALRRAGKIVISPRRNGQHRIIILTTCISERCQEEHQGKNLLGAQVSWLNPVPVTVIRG